MREESSTHMVDALYGVCGIPEAGICAPHTLCRFSKLASRLAHSGFMTLICHSLRLTRREHVLIISDLIRLCKSTSGYSLLQFTCGSMTSARAYTSFPLSHHLLRALGHLKSCLEASSEFAHHHLSLDNYTWPVHQGELPINCRQFSKLCSAYLV
jgi:hypothetical protein